jgi:hypothetical protein
MPLTGHQTFTMAAHNQHEGELHPSSLSCKEAQLRKIKRLRQDILDESNAMKFRQQVTKMVGIPIVKLFAKLNAINSLQIINR